MDGEIDTVQLIREVEKRPVLWNPNNPDYSRRGATTSAWEEVAASLDPDSENWSNYEKFGKVRDVQKRWRNIRDIFVKEMKYEQRVARGMAIPKKNKYVYSDLLQFLVPAKKKQPINKSSSEKSSSDNDETTGVNIKTNSMMATDDGYSSSNVASFCQATLGSCSDNRVDKYFENKIPERHLSPRVFATKTNSMMITNMDYSSSNAASFCQATLGSCSDDKVEKSLEKKVPEQNLSPRVFATKEIGYPDVLYSGAHSASFEEDDDKMFLLSLLPYFKKLHEERKLQARINVTKLLHDMIYRVS